MSIETPSLPRACLRVGAVGHTDLGSPDGEEWQRVRQLVGAALRDMSEATARTVRDARAIYAEELPQLRLLTSLAPGFDRLVADEWIRQDVDGVERAASWILPDRPGHAAAPGDAEFERLRRAEGLASHSEVAVCLRGKAAHGHEAATRFLVQHCDVLLACWNGERGRPDEPGRPSFTWLAVKLAAQRGIPVLWIPSATTAEHAGDDGVERLRAETVCLAPVSGAAAGHALPQLLRHLTAALAPFGSCAQLPDPRPPDHWRPKVERSPEAEALLRVSRYAGEPRRLEDSGQTLLAGLWRHAWALTRRRRAVAPSASSAAQPPETTGLAGSRRPASSLWAHQLAADRRATLYADLHRGSLLTLAVLAPLAVVLSVALLVFDLSEDWVASVVFAAAETATILLIIGVYRDARRGGWHERSVEYRALAESLRQTSWLWTLAAPGARPPEAPFRPGHRNACTWMTWYHDALVRALDPGEPPRGQSLRTIDQDSTHAMADHALEHWFLDQRDYYASTHPRYRRLNRFVVASLAWLVWMALAAGLLSLLRLQVSYPATPPSDVLTRLFVLVGVGAPALAAALHSLVGNLEAERLASNYEQMADDLEQRERDLRACLADGTLSDLRRLRDVQAQATHAARAMMAEVEDWHAATSNHPPVLA